LTNVQSHFIMCNSPKSRRNQLCRLRSGAGSACRAVQRGLPRLPHSDSWL